MSGKNTPVIAVLATGGTIAGQAPSSTRSREYTPGAIAVGDLLDAVPGLKAVAAIQSEQVANIGSEDMTEAVWMELAAAVKTRLADPAVEGVVVLHGTDTMEETAYFLHLAVSGDKPVVLTGAMRPANSVGADGPANILDAVRLASSPEARGKGALICLNGVVSAARDATKTDAASLAAFSTPVLGELGRMVDDRPDLHRSPLRERGGFVVEGLNGLPRVEIVYGHAGQKRELIDAAVEAGAEGIVHAGVGMGMVHKDARPALVEAVGKGVAVVCASRVGNGPAPVSGAMSRDGFVAAGNLNPQKARVLLQLALTVTSEPFRIQELFDRF